MGVEIAPFAPADEVAEASGLAAWRAASARVGIVLSAEWLLVRDETLDLGARLAKVKDWLDKNGRREGVNSFVAGLARAYLEDKPREAALAPKRRPPGRTVDSVPDNPETLDPGCRQVGSAMAKCGRIVSATPCVPRG